MEKFVYYNYLLEIYKDLLTEKNVQIFEYYYSENLSMQEIADLIGVSKSFVGTTIKNTEKKLEDLESKLHIFEKNTKLKSLLEYDDLVALKKEIENLINE